ncbi:MAG: Adenine DNA glycosylase [Chlamydiia bacterium]|nr:Adenine DNA glycosylase [Chlamydiia bacterium]
MDELIEWFELNRRHMPWREVATPYRVWISEVMLQQTQVSVVIPYFERWMAQFPSVKELAEAPVDEVIKCFEGLGYYSRARNLHKGAKYFVEKFGGEIPPDYQALIQAPGIGHYTAGAILNFAFHKPVPAVDGNVARVMARYIGYEKEITKAKHLMEIREEVKKRLPVEKGWVFSEALIELGALVCKKTPACHACPLALSCVAYADGREVELPKRGARQKVVFLYRMLACITFDCYVLVRKEQKGALMADLWQFPYLEGSENQSDKSNFTGQFQSLLGLDLTLKFSMERVSHTFTRYQAHLFPTIYEATEKTLVPGYEWVETDQITALPFCSGHRQVARSLVGKEWLKKG